MTFIQYYKKSVKKHIGACLTVFILSCNALYSQTPDFNVVLSHKCAPAVATIYNESGILPGLNYLWDFGKGGVAINNNAKLEESYTNPGSYTISLRIINGTDTSEAFSKTIVLADGPNANFHVDKTSGCVPLSIQFSDASTAGDGAITEYYWDFSTGQTATGSSVSHTYTLPGDYDVFYRVTDINGCSDDYKSNQLIKAFKIPTPNFSASERFACNPPLYVEFTNLSQGSGSLNSTWTFGNGNTANTFEAATTYNNPGVYNVSLSVTDINGCTNSITKSRYIQVGSTAGEIIAITSNDTISENNAVLCPDSIVFKSTLPEQLDYTWIVDYNGAIQSILDTSLIKLALPDSGRIDIKLKFGTTGQCPDSLMKTFIIDYIKADFKMDDQFSCKLPVNVQLQNKSENAVSYVWTMPDNSQSSSVNTNFTIPVINSYEQLYTHLLINHYIPFSLVATSASGCRDTLIDYFVASPPIARLMPDKISGCAPLTVSFYSNSLSVEPINNWKYQIDSDVFNLTEAQSIQYTFNSPGEHTAYLIITNDSACTDTSYTIKINVGDKIIPDFSVNPPDLCFGNSLNLTLNSSLPDNNISFVYSSPGFFNTGEIRDINTSVQIRPDTVGTFPVKLEIDYNGCISDSVIDNAFTVSGPVGGSFHENFDCSTPLSYRFYSDIIGADNLEWKIGDSILIGSDSVDFVFPGSGNYTVTLNASNSISGCSIQKSKIIQVRDVYAEITLNPVGCLSDYIFFNSANSVDYIDSCYNEGFRWTFGDGSPDRRTYNTSYPHRYYNTGIYQVKLEVTAENGCKAYDSTEIKIVMPAVNFTVEPALGCGPELDVQLTYTSSDSTISSWEWIFGDNTFESNSNDTQVTHRYNSQSNITYTAGLYVTDIYGCWNYMNKTVSMVVTNAEFQASQRGICKDKNVLFIPYENEYDSFRIDFGDGFESITTLNHQYTTAGIFTVSLTVWKNGCSNTKVKSNYITVEDVSADFVTNPAGTITCYPALIEFTHTNPSGNIKSGMWTFGDGGIGAYNSSVEHNYTLPGTYNSSLHITTLYNCEAETFKQIVVTGPVAEYSFSPEFVCDGGFVTFHIDNIENTDEFEWNFGDGFFSSEPNPTHQYFGRENLYPALRIKKGNCEKFLVDTVTLSKVEANFDLSEPTGNFCEGEPLNATNRSLHYSESVWSINGNPVSSDNHLINFQFNTIGENHELELVVTDFAQCTDTIVKPFAIRTLPDFDISGDTQICIGNAASVSIPGFQTSWNIQWEPQEIFTNSTTANTEARPDTTTVINATVSNEFGCSATHFLLINVKDSYTLTRSPSGDTSIYIGESLQLLADANDESVTYSWTPQNNISCTNCPNPVVNPLENTTYILTTTDGCAIITAEFFIEVIVDYYLELPNAFSPNDDGENDIFKYEADNIAEVEFKIFNRWGNLVFSSNNINEGWDGRQNGKLQNIDTYTYFVKAKTLHGFEIEKKGTFLLIK